DDVALRQAPRPVEPYAVQERAVRRAEILNPDAILSRLEARVARRRILVRRDWDVVLVPAADRQLRRVELEALAVLKVRALDDDEAAGDRARSRVHAGSRGRSEDEALLGQTKITARRPHDPPDEQVEQDEERDLEDEQQLVDRDRVEDHHPDSRPNVTSVDPTVIVSPLLSFARLTRRPLTSRPFVDPRSTIQYVAPSWRSSAWRLDTFVSESWMSQSRERPMTTRRCFTS